MTTKRELCSRPPMAKAVVGIQPSLELQGNRNTAPEGLLRKAAFRPCGYWYTFLKPPLSQQRPALPRQEHVIVACGRGQGPDGTGELIDLGLEPAL